MTEADRAELAALFDRLYAAYLGWAGMFDEPALIWAERALDAALVSGDGVAPAIARYETVFRTMNRSVGGPDQRLLF